MCLNCNGICNRRIFMLTARNSTMHPQDGSKEASKLCDAAIQVGVVSYKQEQAIRKLQLENIMYSKQNNILEKQIQEQKVNYQALNETVSSMEFKQLEQVQKRAREGNKKAVFW